MKNFFNNILIILLLQFLFVTNCQAEETYYLMPTKSLDEGLTQEELLCWNRWRADLGNLLIHQKTSGIPKGYLLKITFKVDTNRNISDINIITLMRMDKNKSSYNAHLYGDKAFDIIRKKDSLALSNNQYTNNTNYAQGYQNNNLNLNNQKSTVTTNNKNNKVVPVNDRFCLITVQNNKYQLNNVKIYNLKDITDGYILKSAYNMIQKNNHHQLLTFPAKSQRTSVDVEYLWIKNETNKTFNYNSSEFNDYEKIKTNK